MISASEARAIMGLDPDPQPEVEAEDTHALTVSVMCSTPGPLKVSTRVWWTERCPSGPFEGDEELR